MVKDRLGSAGNSSSATTAGGGAWFGNADPEVTGTFACTLRTNSADACSV